MYSTPLAPPKKLSKSHINLIDVQICTGNLTHDFRNKHNCDLETFLKDILFSCLHFFADIDIFHGLVDSNPQQHFEHLKFKSHLDVLYQTHSLSPLLLLCIATLLSVK